MYLLLTIVIVPLRNQGACIFWCNTYLSSQVTLLHSSICEPLLRTTKTVYPGHRWVHLLSSSS
jgi:hypothetical protein